jgi:hypothetical protein
MPKKKKSEAKSQQKEQIKNCKLYLNLDLSSKSAGGLLPYKFILDSLSKSLENKDKTDEDSYNKLREIFISVNKANFDIKIGNIKKKNEKPNKIDLDEAEGLFQQKHKVYEERKNFYNKLVEKGNKLQEDRNDMIKSYEEKKQKLIDESNDYVKNLQKETDPENPERKKLLEENENLKKQIQDTIQEGLKMKDDFDKMLKDSGLSLDNLEKTKGLDIQNTLNQFQEKTTSQIMLNTSLKTQLLEIKGKNAELERFKVTAENQCEQFEKEIKNKVDESMKLSYENLDMQNRIQASSQNKVEVLNLIKEQQALLKKINMMKSLNTKYIKQYEELTGEKISKKKKKKKNKNKNKKKKDNTNSTSSTTTGHDHEHDEHCHDHEHEHEHENNMEILMMMVKKKRKNIIIIVVVEIIIIK